MPKNTPTRRLTPHLPTRQPLTLSQYNYVNLWKKLHCQKSDQCKFYPPKQFTGLWQIVVLPRQMWCKGHQQTSQPHSSLPWWQAQPEALHKLSDTAPRWQAPVSSQFPDISQSAGCRQNGNLQYHLQIHYIPKLHDQVTYLEYSILTSNIWPATKLE